MLCIAVRQNKKRQPIDSNDLITYRCTRCGKSTNDPNDLNGMFFMSKTSPLYVSNGLYTCICITCSNDLYESYMHKYKDEKLALMLLCCHLDAYFCEKMYEEHKSDANFSLGNYLNKLNLRQYKTKNFITYLVNYVLTHGWMTNEQEIREETETKWSSSDRKNKQFVIQALGYDCFDDLSYTSENRKFLYNTLADYLNDDVIEDPHKIQSVILMVKTFLQIEEIDRLINTEIKKQNTDYSSIQSLSNIKSKLSKNVVEIANENGISAKTSGKNNRGANTLTNIMKQMIENDYEDIKTNIFNVKMCETFKNISDISNKSLMEQLNFQSDDWARMVAAQRESIQNMEMEIEKLEETIRLLKVENKQLKEQKKST